MYRIAYSILNNSSQAEDAVADAFERLIPYLDRCRGLTDMKTKRLVITVLRSSALDIYRKNKREQIRVSLDAEDFLDRGVNTIDDYMKRRDCEELAGKIVDLLSEIYAGVIRLRYFYDMDVEEIANILGISVFAQDLEDSYIYFTPSGAGLDSSANDSVQFYDLKPWL
ncbi:RNA polymerase sigma-70 factor (ECF subfamily) [Catenibacillus scindens]|uniref:RNA polymerase sigma-70 factor (ECF subfamily) n=2 Tax=Catenibacillus scindens TaxID=673271 RepID=A0A7W8H8L7_9FIRM|nr:RNA polymerase sigma-70 factor (ECF subfamily) [Catenibacillus scindens]